VRLRSGPGTGYSILGNYNNGTPLTITGTSGDWTAVTINGLKGYMSSAYVTTTKPSTTTANPNSTSNTPSSSTGGQQIVDTAKQYLGYPYVYGGMSPAGFDCSGFVGYVYKLCGYSLKRTASDIFYNNGTSVDKASLQPGDLVFFSNSSESIGHVGIYIGSGQFIHASSSTVGVIISDLNSSYYVQHYQGAKRIIQ
jgi:Cell wall-associated hydrolases (invasion-associated proteins)